MQFYSSLKRASLLAGLLIVCVIAVTNASSDSTIDNRNVATPTGVRNNRQQLRPVSMRSVRRPSPSVAMRPLHLASPVFASPVVTSPVIAPLPVPVSGAVNPRVRRPVRVMTVPRPNRVQQQARRRMPIPSPTTNNRYQGLSGLTVSVGNSGPYRPDYPINGGYVNGYGPGYGQPEPINGVYGNGYGSGYNTGYGQGTGYGNTGYINNGYGYGGYGRRPVYRPRVAQQ